MTHDSPSSATIKIFFMNDKDIFNPSGFGGGGDQICVVKCSELLVYNKALVSPKGSIMPNSLCYLFSRCAFDYTFTTKITKFAKMLRCH